MSKFKVALTLVTVLTVAGCAGNREPGTVRNGPQLENPHAFAPGGKLPAAAERAELAAEAAVGNGQTEPTIVIIVP